MRAHEINLDEAPMNPGEYNKAIDTGHEKGVLVGYEFECVVPKATIKGATAAAPTGKTKEQVAGLISNDSRITDQDLDDFPPKEFDDLFKILPGHSKYPDMVSMLAGYRTDSMEKIKELFAQIPEEIRAEAVPKAKERVSSQYSQHGDNPQIEFAYQFGWVLTNYFSTKRSGGGGDIVEKGYAIRNLAQDPDYNDLLQFGFDAAGYYIENHLTRFFDFDPQKVYDELNLAEYDDDNDNDRYRDDDDYKGAVSILKPALEQSMGRKVTVFKRYHEHKKNMTDWYIEPDGSLEGDEDGDGTAEVVSPPLPAKDAVQALKNFFALAAQHKIYTNESTGLHINVSIPQKIDLLKLAVFTGDQYVLKNFDRLDNDYAEPVTRDIPRRADGEDVIKIKQEPARAGKNVFGQRKQNTVINFDLLKKIATNVSSNHTASISSNGKWISFRHAGGNYLKDYAEIFNVVGRFVRAVIIASDPTMYQQEYKAAVAKLVTPAATLDSLQSTLNYISTKGVPVMEIHMASKSRATTIDVKKQFQKVKNEYYSLERMISQGAFGPNQVTFTMSSASAKQKLIAAASPTGQFKTWVTAAPIDRFFTIQIVPQTAEQFKLMSQDESGWGAGVHTTEGRGYNPDGYFVIAATNIPPNDPRTKQVMLNVRKEHYRNKAPTQARWRA
jgi:hypothetical protein